MTKVLSVFLISVALLFSSCNDNKKEIAFEWKVYVAAMELGDMAVAVNSLNRILAIDTYNAEALDTLAILYQNSNAYDAAAKIAFRALNVRESDALVMVLAKANKGLGKHDVAMENFQKLLSKKPYDLELLYECAYTQINLNKLDEAIPYIQQIIEHAESGSAVLKEYINEGSQLVPYRAVGYNMLGYIQTQAGQNAEAVKSYETALQIFPKYYLASNNLKLINAKIAGL